MRIQRFEVVEQLGAGGMGVVMRAYDPQLEREVAIKTLRAGGAAAAPVDGDTIDLRQAVSGDELLCEARMMARLSHGNVLPVYEVGLVDGALFVVMELVDGVDLARWLAAGRTTTEILAVFAAAGRGLAAAHERGIVHRDFKPANVLIGRDGRVRVADFGLSTLTARGTAMVQLDRGRGTPRYMAPELWCGAPASTCSDVYAYCSALDHALGGEPSEAAMERDHRWRELGLAAPLRAMLAAGLADDPAARPALASVIAAMAPPVQRSGWRYATVASALAVAAIVTALARSGDASGMICDVEPLAAWTPAHRAELAQLRPSKGIQRDQLFALLDANAAAIAGERAAACEARRDGRITDEQRSQRRACLDRRAVELGAIVEYVAGSHDVARAYQRGLALQRAITCTEVIGWQPLAPEVSALYRRLVAAIDLATPERSKDHERELVAIERAARAAGELELAARTARALEVELRFQSRMTDADAALQRAHRDAQQIGSTAIAADVLLERSKLAGERNDSLRATSFAELARDLADEPTVSPMTRARVHVELGAAAYRSGDYPRAIERLEHALELAETLKPRARMIVLDARLSLVSALADQALVEKAFAPRAVARARETLAFVGREFGTDDANYGVALNMVALALRTTGELEAAVELRRQALAKMIATVSATHSATIAQRTDLASDLHAIGDFTGARTELVAALEASEHDQRVATARPAILTTLALVTFELGQYDEAIRLGERARDAAISQRGDRHPDTIATSRSLIAMELELGRFDVAQRYLASLDETFRAMPDAKQQRAVARGTLEAHLAYRRGELARAERLARAALAALAETRDNDWDRTAIQQALGDTLLAQRRFAEARAAFAVALGLSRELHERTETLASIEARLAIADLGLGKPDALDRLRRARSVLARFPGAIVVRKQADEQLARHRR